MNLNKGKSKLFNTIFVYFIVSIVSAFLFLLLTNTYYLNVSLDRTEEEYEHRLEYLSSTLNAMFEELHYSTAMFALTDSVKEVLTNKLSYKSSDVTVIVDTASAVSKFYRTKQFIHSIFIVSAEDDLVIGNLGTGTIQEYLGIVSNYTDYPTDYWRSITYTGRRYTILPPTETSNIVRNTHTEVIPVIQHLADDLIFTDPLVINIERSYITGLLEETKHSVNSIVYLYNNDQDILAVTENLPTTNLSDEELIGYAQQALDSGNHLTRIDGKRYLLVAHRSPLDGNTLCALTPYSDLWSESMALLRIPVLIFIIGITLVTVLSFLLSRRIYSPIHNVALSLRENYLSEKNITIDNDLDFLTQNVQLILSDMLKLKEELSLAIPYVCERYLLSLFDNNDMLHEEEVTDFLAQHGVSFPNKNFIVVHSTLNFDEDFFNIHSKTEYNAICQGSLLIANEYFSTIKDRYIFSVSANQVCVILNLAENFDKSEIGSSILKYHDSLDINDRMLTIHSGVGQLYEGLNGLKQSYNEALQASGQLTYITSSMIRTYSATDQHTSSSTYVIEEENKMINYLLQGNKDMVLNQFQSIIDKNIANNINTHSLKDLYLQLYNTAIRVINRRHLNIYDIMGESYINISSNIDKLKVDELDNYLIEVFGRTIEATSKTNDTNDIANIRQYLDAHFTEELYLDSLADKFGKSSNYVSKYIKKNLGVSFQSYISTLRIQKAKELLSNSSKSIVAIAEEVGFNSRHPFIRKFKILEGITPSEYRKLNRG